MSRFIDADELNKTICNATSDGDKAEYFMSIVDAMPTANVKEVIPCEECIHAKQHSYAPAECQFYCTLSLQYHGGRFFCACGERGTDLLEWIHRGDDDEQSV